MHEMLPVADNPLYFGHSFYLRNLYCSINLNSGHNLFHDTDKIVR